jgi:hypothetical protein
MHIKGLEVPPLNFDDLHIPKECLKYSSEYSVYIIYLEKIFRECSSVPSFLSAFLRKTEVIKVGVDIHSDINAIYNSYNITMHGYVDVQSIARSIGIHGISLNKLSSSLYGVSKVKCNVLKNWNILDQNMIKYAAYDAFLTLIIYYKLINYKVEEEEIKVEEIKGVVGISKEEILEAYNVINILRKTTIFDSKEDPNLDKLVITLINCHKPYIKGLNRLEIKNKLDIHLKYLNDSDFIIYDGNVVKLNI